MNVFYLFFFPSNSAVTIDPVDGFGNRSSFEFELRNVHQIQGKVCSPRFETMPNIFWQLGFVLVSFFIIFIFTLYAIYIVFIYAIEIVLICFNGT